MIRNEFGEVLHRAQPAHAILPCGCQFAGDFWHIVCNEHAKARSDLHKVIDMGLAEAIRKEAQS